MIHRAGWKTPNANAQTFEMYGMYGHGQGRKMLEIT